MAYRGGGWDGWWAGAEWDRVGWEMNETHSIANLQDLILTLASLCCL